MTPPKPNRRDKLKGDFAIFLRKVGRKAQKGQEPNDRRHDRKLERKLKRMSPLEIDALARPEDDEE